MPSDKFKIELDLAGFQKQLDGLVSKLTSVQGSMDKTSESGSKSFSELEKFIGGVKDKITSTLTKMNDAITRSSELTAKKLEIMQVKLEQATISKSSAELTNINKLAKLKEAESVREEKRLLKEAKLSQVNSQQKEVDYNKQLKAAKQVNDMLTSQDLARQKSTVSASALKQKTYDDEMKALEKADRISNASDKARLASIERNSALVAKANRQAIEEQEKLDEAKQRSLEAQKQALEGLQAAAFAAIGGALLKFTTASGEAAAKSEVLATAMHQVTKNMGLTRAEVDGTEATMRNLGMSINDSRHTIMKFSQANMSMRDAVNLSRAAQDLAAGSIHGSSEALEDLTRAIMTGRGVLLKNYGIMTDINRIYSDYAKSVDKPVSSLSELERRQAILNRVFQEAAKRTGAYEQSMNDAAKLWTSISNRVLPDLATAFGEVLIPGIDMATKAIYDFLNFLKDLPPAIKGVVTVIATLAGTILSILAASKGLGIVAKFLGISTETVTLLGGALTSVTPLILGVTAAFLAGSAAIAYYNESVTEGYDLAVSTMAIEREKVDSLVSLMETINKLGDSEVALRDVVVQASSSHKELLPLLDKEKITREDILIVLTKLKEVHDEAAEKARLDAIEKNKAAQKALADEKALLELRQKEVAVWLDITDAKKKNQADAALNKVSSDTLLSMASVKSTLLFWSDLILKTGSIQTNINKINSRTNELQKELATEYKNTGEGAKLSAEDQLKAITDIDKKTEAYAKKTTKIYPFEALEAWKKAQLDDLVKRVPNEELAAKSRIKIEETYLAKKYELNRSYQERKDKLGKTELEKLAVEYKNKIELARGGEEAIANLVDEYASKATEIIATQWDKQISNLEQSTERSNRLIDISLEARISKESAALLDVEGAEERSIYGRVKNFVEYMDTVVSLTKEAAEEQVNNFQYVADERIARLDATLKAGLIAEDKYAEELDKINNSILKNKVSSLEKIESAIKKEIASAIKEEEKLGKKIKSLDAERLKIEEDFKDDIAGLHQKGMTEKQKYDDTRLQATTKLTEAERALHDGNFDEAKRLAKESADLHSSLSDDVTEKTKFLGKETEEVVITSKNAIKASMVGVEDAQRVMLNANKEEKKLAEKSMTEIADKAAELQDSLTATSEEKYDIEVKLKDEATDKIDSIKKELGLLTNKKHIIEVLVKKTEIKGGSEDATIGGVKATSENTSTIAPDKVESGTSVENMEFVGVAEKPSYSVRATASQPNTDTISIEPESSSGSSDSSEGYAEGIIGIDGKGTSTSDSILAWLSKGESVLSAKTTEMFRPILELMQNKPLELKNKLFDIPKFGSASGGDTTTFGNIILNISGVKDVSNMPELNWKKIVREAIVPELKIFSKRKTG